MLDVLDHSEVCYLKYNKCIVEANIDLAGDVGIKINAALQQKRRVADRIHGSREVTQNQIRNAAASGGCTRHDCVQAHESTEIRQDGRHG